MSAASCCIRAKTPATTGVVQVPTTKGLNPARLAHAVRHGAPQNVHAVAACFCLFRCEHFGDKGCWESGKRCVNILDASVK